MLLARRVSFFAVTLGLWLAFALALDSAHAHVPTAAGSDDTTCLAAETALADAMAAVADLVASAEISPTNRNCAQRRESGCGEEGWQEYTLQLRVRLPTPLPERISKTRVNATQTAADCARPSVNRANASSNACETRTSNKGNAKTMIRRRPQHVSSSSNGKKSFLQKLALAALRGNSEACPDSAAAIAADLLQPLQSALTSACTQLNSSSKSGSHRSTANYSENAIQPRRRSRTGEVAGLPKQPPQRNDDNRNEMLNSFSQLHESGARTNTADVERARLRRAALNNNTWYGCSLTELVQTVEAGGTGSHNMRVENLCRNITHDGIVQISDFRFPPSLIVLTVDASDTTHVSPALMSFLTTETSRLSTTMFQLIVNVASWRTVTLKLLTEPAWPASIGRVDVVANLSLNIAHELHALPKNTFTGYPGVKDIFILHPGVTGLQPGIFDALPSLDLLLIGATKISNLHPRLFHSSTSLQWLYLSGNQITSLPPGVFGALTNLRALRISRNKLTRLPPGVFDSQTRVFDFIISQNQLRSLPQGIFDSLGAVDEFFLDGNFLTTLPAGVFDHQTQVNLLNIGSNRLTSIPQGIFDHVTRLGVLSLSDNELTVLPPGIFDNNTWLYVLALTNNNLDQTLPANIFQKTRMRDLHLSNNRNLILPVEILEGLASPDVLQLTGATVVGDLRMVFEEKATSWSLRNLALGWEALNEDTLPISAICGVLASRIGQLRISHSSYQRFQGCPQVNITNLDLTFNPLLVTVETVTNDVLNVSHSPVLATLTTTGTVPIVDASETSLSYSTQLCNEIGGIVLFAKRMRNTPALKPRALLPQCFLHGLAFDFSGNNDLLPGLSAFNAVAPARVALNIDNRLRPNFFYQFEDTRERVTSRTELPILLFDAETIECRTEFEVASLVGSAPVPAFSVKCGCARGFRLEQDLCVSTALTSAELAGIVIGSSIAVLILTLAVQFAIRWVRHKQRERYILLGEKELQEQLLNEANEEVSALKQGWRINLDEISLICKVDEGAFGAVWKGDWEGVAVAVKFLKLASQGMVDQFMREDIDKEVDFLQRTRHPNLVRFFGTGTDKHGAPFLVLEFVNLGSLKHILHEQGLDAAIRQTSRYFTSSTVSEHIIDADEDFLLITTSRTTSSSTSFTARVHSIASLKLCLVGDIVDGMAFLHSLNIMHRDLKSGNVLVNKRLVAKITDFGSMSGKLSKIQQQQPDPLQGSGLIEETKMEDTEYRASDANRTVGLTMTAGVGTPLYMAPEILDPHNRRLSLKADVFSFGVLMWEVCECRVPDLIVQEIGEDFKGFLLQTLFRLYKEGRHLNFSTRKDHDRNDNKKQKQELIAVTDEVITEEEQEEIGDDDFEHCPKWYRELSLACMSFRASDRPTFENIQQRLKVEAK